MLKDLEILIPIIISVVCFIIGYFVRLKTAESKIGSAENQAKNILIDAEKESESKKKEILLEAKEEIHRLRDEAEREIKERRNDVQRTEKRILNKEEQLDRRSNNLEKKEESISNKLKAVEEKNKKAEEILSQRISELERISGYTSDEAKEILLEELKNDITQESALLIKEFEAKTKEESHKIAMDILAKTIQRCAPEYVSEHTVTAVSLPNDEMKGRIIGREGRNIRAIEALTGVDLIIDDTPEAVVLSSFDPVRREIARIALEKLILDGRIHPSRIEEMIEKAKREVDISIKEAGESAVFELGILNIHPEIVKMLGKLKYRTSYGQDVLRHSIEVAYIAAMLAEEIGADVKVAKRAGLLHDIGKAMDHEIQGAHVELGVEFLKRYKENKNVLHAVEAHHGDVEAKTIEAVLVQAADAVSAARPGARRETLESYIKRLEKLEEIANSFEGIDKSYAVQAGREVRIIVKPEDISEANIIVLARDVAKRIESEMEYPGQIKVNVIRETRHVDYAK
ncbi:MAG: ribonuclease Y [Tissierellia bacterium]|nr:ribonuclease Y [Tissierellia bacterium]